MGTLINKYYSMIFVVFLVAIIGLSFGVGYQQGQGTTSTNSIVFSCPNTVLEKQAIRPQVLGVTAPRGNVSNIDTAQKQGMFMGSKNGTKYYTPGCPGTKRIKPENYIWFQSIEDATLQGYSKGSC
ncbi:MAG: hypothetical protein AAB681_03330 [Patescibacteria group bacterium]